MKKTDKADKAQDAKLMNNMSPKEKAEFKAKDAKHDKKGMSRAADKKGDKAIAKQVMAKKKK